MPSTPLKWFIPLIIQRYTYVNFFRSLFGALLFFSGMFVIVTLMQELEFFIRISNRTPFIDYVHFFQYGLPFWLSYTYPISAVYAIVFTLGKMNAENELVGIYNSGLHIDRLLIPVYVTLFIFSTLMMVFDKEIFYDNHYRHRAVLQKMRGDRMPEGAKVRENLTIFGKNNKIYFVETYHQTNSMLLSTHILYFDRRMNFVKIVSAKSIKYDRDEKKWHGEGVVIRLFDTNQNISPMGKENLSNKKVKPSVEMESNNDRAWSFLSNNFVTTRYEKIDLPLDEEPYHFEEQYERVDLLSARETLKLAKKYEIIGGNFKRWYTEFFTKIASPYMALVVVFFGVPLSTFSRRATMVISLLLVLACIFLFYVFNQIGQSLGGWGLLPPFLAGWFGNICFLALGLVLRRTIG